MPHYVRILLPLVLGLAAAVGVAQDGAPVGNQQQEDPQEPVNPVEVVRFAESLSARVAAALNDAREAGDIIRVTCLDEKLAQINANLRLAQGRLKTWQEATDPDARAHEETVLGVLAQRFNVLDQEANQCAGESLFETGATDVETEIDLTKVPEDESGQPPMVLPPLTPSFTPPASGQR